MMFLNVYFVKILIIIKLVFSHDDDFGGPSYQITPYKIPVAKGDVYFAESFQSKEETFTNWIISKANKEHKNDVITFYDGIWEIEEPNPSVLFGDLGLVIKSKAKHHAISTKLWKPFFFGIHSLIVQYDVKFQNGLDCGGAYIKLLLYDKNINLTVFHDCTPYVIMFGPDKCGSDAKIHFIFKYKNPLSGQFEEKRSKKIIPTEILRFFTDQKTHLYRLIINPNNSYAIIVDDTLIFSGNLLSDMEPPINPPNLIIDIYDKKPADWDDRERIPDPYAKPPTDWDDLYQEYIVDLSIEKPVDWLDDEPEFIQDLGAVKPLDWDESIDGTWEPPMILNPICRKAIGCGDWVPPLVKNLNYKGPWVPPMIKNPNYKGPWTPHKIPNPNYFEDKQPYKMSPIGSIGLELWSMSVDIIFDNFIITSDLSSAQDWANQTWRLKYEEEKKRQASSISVVEAFVEAANNRPLLWIGFILVFCFVFLILLVCCCASPIPDEKEDHGSKDDNEKINASPKIHSSSHAKALEYNLLYNEKTLKGQRKR